MSRAQSDRLAERLIAIARETDDGGRPRHAQDEIQDAFAIHYLMYGADRIDEDPEGRQMVRLFLSRHRIAVEDGAEAIAERIAAVAREKANSDLFRAFSAAVATSVEEIEATLESEASQAARLARAAIAASESMAPMEGEGIRANATADGLERELFENFREQRLRLDRPYRR